MSTIVVPALCVCESIGRSDLRRCDEHHRYWRGDKELAAVGKVIRSTWPIKPDYSAADPEVLENARDRGTISFKVPKDQKEDGAGLFDDLWEQAEEKLVRDTTEGVTTEGLTGQYGTLLAVLYFFVVNYQPEQE